MCTTRGVCRGHRKLLGCRGSPNPPDDCQSVLEQRFKEFVFPTVHRVGATPVPIPNTEVKPHFGDGTARFTGGRVARRWDSLRNGARSRRPGAVFVLERSLQVVNTAPGSMGVRTGCHHPTPIFNHPDRESINDWPHETASRERWPGSSTARRSSFISARHIKPYATRRHSVGVAFGKVLRRYFARVPR